MKKLFLIACTLVLGASLSFAQGAAQSGDTAKTTTTTSTTKTKKKTTKAHTHKAGKKSKKSGIATSTPAPK
jgi:hypothetical protein